ncbi:MAG: hypothetical protein MZV65_40155 [Chromatiales bacterium]|nr:hypothetical protein [Chromatiales bacterium]
MPRCSVGMADPTDLYAYDELARVLKREIEFAVVDREPNCCRRSIACIAVPRRSSGLAQELTAELSDIPVEFGDLLGPDRRGRKTRR